MKRVNVCLALLLALGSVAAAHAQGTHDNTDTEKSDTTNKPSGVKTGHGPLSKPIPPAVSTTNPNEYLQQNPQRPQKHAGARETNPPKEPFGSR